MVRFFYSFLPDLFLIAGYFLFIIGLYMIYPPSSFIGGGIILMAAFYPKTSGIDSAPINNKKVK